MINHQGILKKLRSFMAKNQLDFFIVSSTDEYLDEFVDVQQNSRYVLTGFSGSAGETLVTPKDVFLFVDGRYHIQADDQANKEFTTVIKTGMDKSPYTALIEKICEIAKTGQIIGIVSSKISYFHFKKLDEALQDKNIVHLEFNYDPVLKFANIDESMVSVPVRYVPVSITGVAAEEKFNLTVEKFDDINIDILILTKLEEIAYISNLRGNEIPCSSSFRAKTIIDRDKCTIFVDPKKISPEIKQKSGKTFDFKDEESFIDYLKTIKNKKIGFNALSTSLAIYRQITDSNSLVEIDLNPIAKMKSIKNDAELNHMQDCFRSTDIVMSRVISWLNQSLAKNKIIKKKDFAAKVKNLFNQEGAYGLSFDIIAASGETTAIVHHKNFNPEKHIESGVLILLDCGAYFEGGYATDITRTFLAGGTKAQASPKMKKIYTKVLKAFLNGLNYEVNEETTGFDIDKKIREIINFDLEEGFEFSHGSGHGIGLPVHESPPRLGPAETSKTKLELGMCFTIEPGLYKNGWGGIRLENTVTLIKEDSKLKIKTLTRSRFDENLINYDDLSEQEISWLKDYQKKAIG